MFLEVWRSIVVALWIWGEALVQIQLVSVLYICPKCLERIQGNLQTFSQIDVFLRAGVSHGALTCWGRKEIK